MSQSQDRAPRRAAMAFVFVTVVLDVLALAIVIPIHPKLVAEFLGGDTAAAARTFGLFCVLWALMQLLFSPVMGALSDRFGRRRVLLLSTLGLGLDYFLMALAPSLSWLLWGRVISGITAASSTTAAAYIADVTPPERRAAGFGTIGAAFGLGFVIGPAIGGLLGGFSPRLPFWVAGGLTLCNALYGVLVLPESLPVTRRKPFSWRRANPIGALMLLRSHPQLLGLAWVFTLYWLARDVLSSVFVLYTSHRYGWGQEMIGLALATLGIAGVLVQGWLVRQIVARIGERRAVLAGLLFGAVGFMGFALANTGTRFLGAVPLLGLSGLFVPSMQGLMTRRVAPTEQGQLQGATSSLQALTGLFGPSLFSQTFAYFISAGAIAYQPGAPFIMASLILLLAIPLAAWVTRQPLRGPAAPS